MFLGKFDNCIDSKSRMIVPAKFREQLGPKCVVAMGLDHCLDLYPEEDFIEFASKINSLPVSDGGGREFKRDFFSTADSQILDKQGRLLLNAELKKYAGIDKELVTVGVMSKIEIWDKKTWEERNSGVNSPSDRAEKLREYGL